MEVLAVFGATRRVSSPHEVRFWLLRRFSEVGACAASRTGVLRLQSMASCMSRVDRILHSPSQASNASGAVTHMHQFIWLLRTGPCCWMLRDDAGAPCGRWAPATALDVVARQRCATTLLFCGETTRWRKLEDLLCISAQNGWKVNLRSCVKPRRLTTSEDNSFSLQQ